MKHRLMENPHGGWKCIDCSVNSAKLSAFPGIPCLGESIPDPIPEPHLAAAYGEMTGAPLAWLKLQHELEAAAMTPQSPLTPFGEALQSLSHGLAGAVTSQRSDSWAVDIQRCDCADEVCPCIEPGDDAQTWAAAHAFWDATKLAAHKHREKRANRAENGDKQRAYHALAPERKKQREFLAAFASAMSTPLTFEPRVGHKGCQIDE